MIYMSFTFQIYLLSMLKCPQSGFGNLRVNISDIFTVGSVKYVVQMVHIKNR